MSVETVCKTQIKDADTLKDALTEIFGQGKIEVVKEGVSVTGYYSMRKPTVIIKIPGLIGTAGYAKTEDGTYELVYDSSDRYKLGKLIPAKNRNGVTENGLMQVYAKHQIKKAMKSLRGRVASEQKDAEGNIRLRVKINNY